MSSSISLQKLAELVVGELVSGPCEAVITGINSIMDAGPGDATFLGNVRYLPALKTTRASVALVPEDLDVSEVPQELALIRVKNPTLAFSSVIRVFGPPSSEFVPGVHETASVASDAEVVVEVREFNLRRGELAGDRAGLQQSEMAFTRFDIEGQASRRDLPFQRCGPRIVITSAAGFTDAGGGSRRLSNGDGECCGIGWRRGGALDHNAIACTGAWDQEFYFGAIAARFKLHNNRRPDAAGLITRRGTCEIRLQLERENHERRIIGPAVPIRRGGGLSATSRTPRPAAKSFSSPTKHSSEHLSSKVGRNGS